MEDFESVDSSGGGFFGNWFGGFGRGRAATMDSSVSEAEVADEEKQKDENKGERLAFLRKAGYFFGMIPSWFLLLLFVLTGGVLIGGGSGGGALAYMIFAFLFMILQLYSRTKIYGGQLGTLY